MQDEGRGKIPRVTADPTHTHTGVMVEYGRLHTSVTRAHTARAGGLGRSPHTRTAVHRAGVTHTHTRAGEMRAPLRPALDWSRVLVQGHFTGVTIHVAIILNQILPYVLSYM